MSLNLVIKACFTMSTAISDAITIQTSGNNTQRWSVKIREVIIDIVQNAKPKKVHACFWAQVKTWIYEGPEILQYCDDSCKAQNNIYDAVLYVNSMSYAKGCAVSH